MDSIIAAVITGVATLFGAALMYSGKINQIKDSLGGLNKHGEKLAKDHADLTKDHADLTKDHVDLSKDHVRMQTAIAGIQAISEDTKKSVAEVGYSIREEKNNQKMRYEALTKDQQQLDNAIAKGVSSITALKEAFAETNYKNQELNFRMNQLVQDHQALKDKCARLSQDNTGIKTKYNQLLDRYNNLAKQADLRRNPPQQPQEYDSSWDIEQ